MPACLGCCFLKAKPDIAFDRQSAHCAGVQAAPESIGV